MSSLMSSGSAAGPPPNHASSALVLEFVCLFTHDLKRKQKRWQDGRIKYHTFNKRVMVYDDRGNFVGDMHWRRDWDFDDGEEVELERGGVIVQVNECVGRQNQDLTELVDKRVKEREQRQAKIAARPSILRGLAVRTPMPKPRLPPPPPQDNCQTRHLPLQQVIGTPSGHYGRAMVPTESPFEQRQKANESPAGEINPRPAKRQRYDITPPSKRGYAQSLFGATLTLSAVPLSSAPVRRPAPQQSRAWAETPLPSKHQNDSTSPPASSSEPPSRSIYQKAPSRSDGIPSPAQAPQRRKTAPPPRDPAKRNETDKPEREDGLDLDRHSDQASRDPTRNVISSHCGAASSSVASAQPNIGSGDSSTRTLFEGVRQPAKTIENAAKHPLLSKPTAKPHRQEAAQVIILDEGWEEERAAQMAPPLQRLEKPPLGSESATSEIRTKPQPPYKTMAPLPPSRIPPEPKPDTGSTPLLNVPPPTEERTELRLGPRQKRGLLMVTEPPPKAKKAKKGKSASKQPTMGRSTARPAITNVDADLTCVTGKMKSLTPADEDAFSWSPPKLKRYPTPQVLGNPPQQSLGTPFGAETTFGELALPTPIIHSPAGPQISTVEGSFAHQKRGESSGQIPRPCEVGMANSPAAAINFDEASDANSNRAMPEGRTQPVHPYDNMGCHCPEDDSSLATDSRHKPAPKEPEKQAPRASKQPIFEVESSEDEFPRVPVGPRLARLPRKSIKSREVIGYIPSSSPIPGLLPRRPPSLPVAQHISKPSGSIYATTPLEWGEVQPTDGGLHGPKENEALGPTVEALSASSPPMQEHLPLLIQTSELPDGGPPLEIANDSTLSCESAKQHASEHRGRQPSPPGSDGCQRASGSANDAEILSRITSAPATNPPHSMTSIAEHTAITETTKSITLAAFSPNVYTGAEREASAQPGPAGQTNDSGSTSNAGGLPCSLERTPSVEECPREGKNLDASSGNGPNKPPRRIANPATRGRKAALKSHAAGQVPQSVLPPPDPVLPRPNVRLPSNTRLDSAGNERPKRKMQFPGFMSAKEGGPWSKEADDLLGIGRPAP